MRGAAATTMLAAALAAGGAVGAAEPPAALFEAAEEAAALCRELGGVPAIRRGYLTRADLNGDGFEDYLTDQANLECAGAWTAFCGSAGCPVTAWLSQPGGHVPFAFGYLQAVEVVEAGPLPAVRAHYHGGGCGEGRGGIEGCTRTWVFATNAPETPAIDPAEPEAVAEVVPEDPPPPAAAPPAEAVAPGWTLRQTADAGLLALGGGTGAIASLAAFCLEGRPFLAVSFLDAPTGDTVALGFAFGAGAVTAEARHEETAGGAYVVALADGPLAARLAGRDSEVEVAVDGETQGVLSLRGSTRSVRNALTGCYPF
jgi:hypothetical protein